MELLLKDRIIVVTGGAQGIGRTFALAFAGAGGHVVIGDIDPKAQSVVAEITNLGGTAQVLYLDVSDEESVRQGIGAIIEEHGRVDVLVNNAALFSQLAVKPFDQISLAEWERVLRINTTGVFLCCREVISHMKRAQFGRIVNIASAAARMGRPNYLHYIASKGAVEAMTRSLARELGSFGITANSIAPGAIFTEIPRETVTDAQKTAIIASQCIPRPGTPNDLVSTALHLASPSSGYVTGQTFVVDGGVLHG